jgi:ABC-type phosphate/phosphonate transport system substrate-binding protein/predicted enzyme related to lactoylglutathione lyase
MRAILTIIAAPLLVLLAFPAGAQTITKLTLDTGSGGNLGQYASHAIVDGNPAISYLDDSNGDLKYVRALDPSGSTWGTPVTVESAGSVGRHTSLTVVNGKPAISYEDISPNALGDLKYVRALDASGATWGTPVTLDSAGSVGQYTSLVVVAGNPAISYFGSGDLKYVRATDADGTSWGTPMAVDSADSVGQYTSLAVVNSNPAISYYDSTNTALKYVRAADTSGTSWGTPVTVDTNGTLTAGLYGSLVVVNGNPAISYYQGSSQANLRYVRATDASGIAWAAPVTLDSAGTVGQHTSLEIVNGNPAVSYYDSTNGDLKYVRASDASGAGWNIPVTLDSTGTVGQFTSLLVVNGNPAISYYDVTNTDLKYVRASDASGASWPTAIIVDANILNPITGPYSSHSIVNGNPAISYFNSSNGDLQYIRATDASGTTWGPRVAVDVGGSVGPYTSLTVVNGNPAISYYDSDPNDNLKYARALDTNGSSWGPPVIVDSTGSVGRFSSLKVVNGNPAISYYDSTSNTLKYVRASDVSGTGWSAPVAVSSSGPVGGIDHFSSLAVVNGNPAISYYDSTSSDLKYVRASDANGAIWNAPVTLDSVGIVGQCSSLLVVNGNPAVSYLDGTSVNLKYVRATDPSGANWSTPVTLQSSGNVGYDTSLAIVSGMPAISYRDTTNAALTYVRATDASGTNWGAPVILDNTVGPFGFYTSLAVVNGNPAISYYDDINGNLKWATLTFDADTTACSTPGS